EGPNLPYRRGAETVLCSTAKLAAQGPSWVKTRIHPVRAYVSFRRLRTLGSWRASAVRCNAYSTGWHSVAEEACHARNSNRCNHTVPVGHGCARRWHVVRPIWRRRPGRRNELRLLFLRSMPGGTRVLLPKSVLSLRLCGTTNAAALSARALNCPSVHNR